MFELPALPYSHDALEPHIDARTMEIHHSKHHQGYVNKLNTAVNTYPELKKKTVEELISDIKALPEEIRTAVRNNGGGHYNHSLFWTIMKKGGGGQPQGALADALKERFGSVDKFKEEFGNTAAGQFGSGWAWLVVSSDKKLQVLGTPNQNNPIIGGSGVPILVIDVWEHAYYLKYQNKRSDYVAAWWNVVNWDEVIKRFEAALS